MACPTAQIVLGRCTKSEDATSSNGYFDGKVLSRSHAEVWFDPELAKVSHRIRAALARSSIRTDPSTLRARLQVLVRDLGSVNGTYVGAERLSPSGQGRKSEPRELKDGDRVVSHRQQASSPAPRQNAPELTSRSRVDHAGLWSCSRAQDLVPRSGAAH